MRIEQRHIFAIISGIVLLVLSIILFRKTIFLSLFITLSIIISLSQFWIDFLNYNKTQKEIEENFPEFVRNFVSGVKSGMPATKAIILAAKEDYEGLTPYVKKLKNQLEWNIPFHKALKNFADSTNNAIIRRAISTVIEAEKSGGNLVSVLTAVTDSLLKIKKIKQERRAAMHAQVLQNYVIFFVFLGIIIIIQVFLIPYLERVGQSSFGTFGTTSPFNIPKVVKINFNSVPDFVNSISLWAISLNGIFMSLVLIQGLFAGIVTGIMTEGDFRYGIKHSVILMIISFVVMSLAQSII
ncbi:MAG: type II secretion system F family protein [Candidatus Woesearchaeota archaeon]